MTLTSGPLLIVTAGPGRGRTVPLEGVIQIGREVDNTLPIGDPALSRRHCVVDANGSDVVIRDLASRNGVFVNGCPVTERRLADGDQIRIGDSALLVMIPTTTAPRNMEVSVVFDATTPPASTITLALAESSYLREERDSDFSNPRAAADLRQLFDLSNALQSATNVNAVYQCLVQHAVDAFAGSDGAVLTRLPGDDALTTVAARSRAGKDVRVNQEVAARAIEERVAVLAEDMPAVLVPLLTSDAQATVLCITGSAQPRRLDKDDLQLAAAFGVIGGLALERAAQADWLRSEAARLRQDAGIEHSLVGECETMKSVYRFIGRVSPTDATVLLRGESGTGKELLANAIHSNSQRKHGPFVPINCAALPDALLESELFGHERGAFTGAVSQQRGRLEFADRGTVFLDEIASSHHRSRRNCCVFSRIKSSSASARGAASRLMCASLLPRTSIWKRHSHKERSEQTCTTASTSSR
jgi:hypothetical protein